MPMKETGPVIRRWERRRGPIAVEIGSSRKAAPSTRAAARSSPRAIGPTSKAGAAGVRGAAVGSGPRSTGRGGVDRDRREVGDRGGDDEHVEDLVVAEDASGSGRVAAWRRRPRRSCRATPPARSGRRRRRRRWRRSTGRRSRRSSRRSDRRRPRPSSASSIQTTSTKIPASGAGPDGDQQGGRRGCRRRRAAGTASRVPAISRKIIEWSRRRIHIRAEGRFQLTRW